MGMVHVSDASMLTKPMLATVLIVEDNQTLRKMLGRALREAGFQVVEAGDGASALDALNAGPPDAVVLDLGLPDDRGGDVLDWFRDRERNGQHAPARVVISAQNREEATWRYGDVGPRFLPKPFDPWYLVRLLDNLVSHDVRTNGDGGDRAAS